MSSQERSPAQLAAAHNAARILANLAHGHLNPHRRLECNAAARALYAAFGEPSPFAINIKTGKPA